MKITEIITESVLDDKETMAWVAWSNTALVKLIQTVRALYDPKNVDILEQYQAHLGSGEDARPTPKQVDWLVATTKHWIKPGTWTAQENAWFMNLDEIVGNDAPLYEFAREQDTLATEIIPWWKEWKKEHGISLNSIRQNTTRPAGSTLQ
jgi:hypothetical protein